MIVDTTYLLPLSRIGIDTDLLKAVSEGKTQFGLNDIKISTISIFELQAKAAKSRIPTNYTSEAFSAIFNTFKTVPFYDPQIMEVSSELLKDLRDYIDCIIVATAIQSGEDLVTEDSRIHKNKNAIQKKYKIRILNYKEILLDKFFGFTKGAGPFKRESSDRF